MTAETLLRVLCVGLVCLHAVLAQSCTAPKKGPGAIFPDLVKITDGSYMSIVESNMPYINSTIYMTEYVDAKTQRYRNDFKVHEASQTFLYFEETDEMFGIRGESCEAVTKSVIIEQLSKFPDLKVEGNEIFGPTFIIRAAYRAWKTDGNIGVSDDSVIIRGMSCSVWTWCTKTGETVKLYFTDPRMEHPYGLDDIPVPVRVTVQHQDKRAEYQEYFRFIPKFPAKQMDEVMLIPPTKGCTRSEDIRKAPSFITKDVYLEAEIIYTPFRNNSKQTTYVTNLKYMSHKLTKIAAVHWTPWTSKSKDGVVVAGDHMFMVYDSITGITYTMDRTKEDCKMSRDDIFDFSLPDGSKLNDFNEDLLFFGDDASSYHFLGQTTERGLPAAIFEKKEEKVEDAKRRILTRYYLDDSALLDDAFQEKNAPLKMILWNVDDFSLDKPETFIGELIINIYGFQTHFRNVHQMFDVSACLEDEDQSKWFQLIFPLGDNRLSDIEPHLTHIRNDLPSLLQSFDKDNSPLRIPRIQVDSDPQNIYVTGLILERPHFLLDFISQDGQVLKQNPDKTRTRISTLKECAKSCLENPFCAYFSYCGAVCVIAKDNNLKYEQDMEPKAGCKLYNNALYNVSESKSNSVWTMDQLSSSIGLAVEARSLRMTYFKPDGTPLDLTADMFKDNIAFGRNGMEQTRGTDPDKWFKVFKTGFKLIGATSEGSRTLNKVSFEKCKSIAATVPWSGSISYCLDSGECLISPSNQEEIKADQLTDNSQCMILGRNYLDRFRELQGTYVVVSGEKSTAAVNAEECAKNCFQEKSFDCLSFDLCFYDEKKCVMHKRHYDTGTPSDNDQFKASQECSHYSRSVIHDFNLSRNKDMTKNVAGLRVDNVTPPHYCVTFRHAT